MRKKFFAGVLFFLCAVLLTASADKKQKTYELIYKDVQELKKQFQELNVQIDKNNEAILGVAQQIKEALQICRLLQVEQRSLKENQQQTPLQIQKLVSRLDTITSQLSQLTEDMIEVKNAMAQPVLPEAGGEKNEAESSSSLVSGTESKGDVQGEKEQASEETKQPVKSNLSPREVYNMAHFDYLKGNYSLAVEGFKIYLDQFPESPYADNALYWIGECYFSQRDFKSAVEYFKRLILEYPQGDKVPAAYLKRGISLLEMGDQEQALSVFMLLTSKFPLEEEAKIAQEKIKEITKNERCQQPQ